MLLAHIPEVLEAQKEISYTYQLYEIMIEAWLEREKKWVDKKILRDFSERLAIDILLKREERKMERVPYEELLELAKKWCIEADWKLLTGRSLLNRDVEGNFKFAHRSIMEYLFIDRFLKSDSDDRPETQWTDQMKAFLQEKIKSMEAKKNLDRVDLSDSDLTGMYFSGFSFINANLTNANLTNANLTNANLTNANFTNANLTNANFTNANLQRVTFELGVIKDASLSSANLQNVTFVNTKLKMTFVYIRPGTFMMGSPKDEPGRYDHEILHEVKLTKGFLMQTTPVTQGQWKAVMGNNPSRFHDCGDDCSVETVSWNDVQEFISKLNELDGGGNKYRLPTEAEWEYACRAGTTTPFAFGKCLFTDDANYDGNYPLDGCPKGEYRGKTIPVGSLKANDWGLYDMHGNVWEWVQDWYGDYPTGSVTDPVGPKSGSGRVVRGGGWDGGARNCRSGSRRRISPDDRYADFGFRLFHSRF
jgi:formylglycine-generating enzyme required for sulfatase activity